MSRIAIVGAGISGMAAAYFLSRKHEVHLFEQEERLGGHTHTHLIDTAAGPLAIDTGFIVHNDRTYPNLVRLFAELKVESQPSDMSFAVTCYESGFEYSSRGVDGFFAQRRNFLRGDHYKLLAEIVRFNRGAQQWLQREPDASVQLREYVEKARLSGDFARYYLYPMACAVWSTSPEEMHSFPALTLLRFLDNHGMLGINTHPRWKSVRGGSHSYIAPLTAAYQRNITTGARIQRIARDARGAEIHLSGAPPRRFDEVVLACHGNQALALLEYPTEAERRILGKFTTSRNEACLHTDTALLPRRAEARASWNYNLGLRNGHSKSAATLTYHMNRLQALSAVKEYCVSLNAEGIVDDKKVLKRMTYFHPLYTLDAIRAQQHWGEISGHDHTHYCGAYWFYGFHEDGLNSALRVVNTLGVSW